MEKTKQRIMFYDEQQQTWLIDTLEAEPQNDGNEDGAQTPDNPNE